MQILRAPDHSGIFIVRLRPKFHFYQAPASQQVAVNSGVGPCRRFSEYLFQIAFIFHLCIIIIFQTFQT